ncbi:MAG: hypothetical protein BWY77_01212 [bacterium ADurb.Bin431]|nr:MAG: hypothetical protein BWY77_01212 [bacterium ADurb.Bin431]
MLTRFDPLKKDSRDGAVAIDGVLGMDKALGSLPGPAAEGQRIGIEVVADQVAHDASEHVGEVEVPGRRPAAQQGAGAMVAPAAIGLLSPAGHGKIGPHQKAGRRQPRVLGRKFAMAEIARLEKGGTAKGVDAAEIGARAAARQGGPAQQGLKILDPCTFAQGLLHKITLGIGAVPVLVHRFAVHQRKAGRVQPHPDLGGVAAVDHPDKIIAWTCEKADRILAAAAVAVLPEQGPAVAGGAAAHHRHRALLLRHTRRRQEQQTARHPFPYTRHRHAPFSPFGRAWLYV